MSFAKGSLHDKTRIRVLQKFERSTTFIRRRDWLNASQTCGIAVWIGSTVTAAP